MNVVAHLEMAVQRRSRSGALRRLWCAVILQQVKLVLSPKRRDPISEIAAAHSWFGGKDFYIACAFAEVDPERVLGFMRPHLNREGVA